MTFPGPAAESPAPTKVVIQYNTGLATHKQTLYCREWSPAADLGLVLDWNTVPGTTDLKAMIDEFLAQEKTLLSSAGSFDLAFVYTYAAPGDPGTLVRVYAPAVAGTHTVVGWNAGVQLSINGKDSVGETARLCMMDADVGNDFGKKYLADITTEVVTLWAIYANINNGWASKANNQPTTLVSQTATLNEKLRREYRMS